MHCNVIIINKAQARVGFKFIFEGASQSCLNCEYYSACVKNLEKGRLYVISKVMDKTLPCKLLKSIGCVVEVKKSLLELALDIKFAIEGATVTFNPVECNLKYCRNREVCFPLGIFLGDKVKILKIKESIECPIKRKLKLSLVELL